MNLRNNSNKNFKFLNKNCVKIKMKIIRNRMQSLMKKNRSLKKILHKVTAMKMKIILIIIIKEKIAAIIN